MSENNKQTPVPTKKVIIKDIVDRLECIKRDNGGKVPYGWIANNIKKANDECPTLELTKHHINNEVKAIEYSRSVLHSALEVLSF